MKYLLLILAALVSGVAFGQNEEAALKMVKELRLGQNLGGMSYKMGKLTTTYQGISAKVGPQKADEMFKSELALTVPRYQSQWDKNLAKAWAPLMTSKEFESIVAEKQKSPYAAKFASLQSQAGAAMKSDSEKLLTTVMTEALSNTLNKSTAK